MVFKVITIFYISQYGTININREFIVNFGYYGKSSFELGETLIKIMNVSDKNNIFYIYNYYGVIFNNGYKFTVVNNLATQEELILSYYYYYNSRLNKGELVLSTDYELPIRAYCFLIYWIPRNTRSPDDFE